MKREKAPVPSEELPELQKTIETVIKESRKKSPEKKPSESKNGTKPKVRPESRKKKAPEEKMPEPKEVPVKEEEKPEETSPEMAKDLNDLRMAEQELAQLEKELGDISSMDPEEMMFKGLSSERQRRKLHGGMEKRAQKTFDKKSHEVEKLRERIAARKQLIEKEKQLKAYRSDLNKASISAKPMESAYYEDLIDTTMHDINGLNKKVKGGFWKRLFSAIRGK